ncbi:hypothetical protein ACTFIT_002732 [Dictyostelium discoideum]
MYCSELFKTFWLPESINSINWKPFNGFSKLQRVYIDDINFIYKPIPTITYLAIYTFSSLAFDQPFPIIILLKSIDLTFQYSNSYDFPIEFSLMENPQWYTMLDNE